MPEQIVQIMATNVIHGWHAYCPYLPFARESATLGKPQRFSRNSSQSSWHALKSVVADYDDVVERLNGEIGWYIAPVVCTVDDVKEESIGSGRYAYHQFQVAGTIVRTGEFKHISQWDVDNVMLFTEHSCPYVPQGLIREFVDDRLLKDSPHDWPKIALLKALSLNRLDVAKLIATRFWRKLKRLDQTNRKALRNALMSAFRNCGDNCVEMFDWALKQWPRIVCRDNCKFVKTLIETACTTGSYNFQKWCLRRFSGLSDFCQTRLLHLIRLLLCRESIDFQTLNWIKTQTPRDFHVPGTKWINRTVFKAHENNKEFVREWLLRNFQ